MIDRNPTRRLLRLFSTIGDDDADEDAFALAATHGIPGVLVGANS